MSEHEAIFDWNHPEASTVVITGAFDNWTGSTKLKRIDNGWETKLKLPWGQKTLYKYIIDGVWTSDPTKPTEYDDEGNLNNIYQCPPKPTETEQGDTSPSTAATSSLQTVIGSVKTGVATAAHHVQKTVAPAISAVSNVKSGDESKPKEPVTSSAAPLISAAESMPPTTAQTVLDKAKSAVQQAQQAATGSLQVPTSTETGVDLHPSETAAAPLLKAAENMPPTTAQAALDQAQSALTDLHDTHIAPTVAAAQKFLPEVNIDKAKETVTAALNQVHESVVVPTVIAGAGAAAAVSSAIPDGPKEQINKNIVDPIKSVLPQSNTESKEASGVTDTTETENSGIGAALKNVTGVDPINVDKIPVETAVAEEPSAIPPVVAASIPVVEDPVRPEEEVSPPSVTITLPTPQAAAHSEIPSQDISTSVPAVAAHVTKDEPLPAVPADASAVPSVPSAAPLQGATTDSLGLNVNGVITSTDTELKVATPPETPMKTFPSGSQDTNHDGTSSAASTPSKFGSARKKRTSIFGKIKHVFHHHDKDKKASE